MTTGRFMLVVLLTALTALSLVLAVTVSTDAYGIYGAPIVAGFNRVKPASSQHAWLAKAARARRARPQVLLLGNSRVDIGLDPRSEAWPHGHGTVFNLGVPGSGISAQPGALDNVASYAPLSQLFIGVEFLDFLDRHGRATDNATLTDRAPPMRLDAHRFVQTALSLSALADTLYTVWEQRNPDAAQMTPLGFNPFREYRAHVANEGHAALAAQKNEDNFRHMLALSPQGWSRLAVDALREQLRTAARLGLPVVLFTFPYHAQMLESMAIAGLWPALEAWKGLLVDLVEEERKQHPGLDVRVWDFTSFSAYTTEPFPAMGDTRTQMHWYWEPGHFKAELGGLMIHRLQGGIDGPAFGAPLTVASLQARLAVVATARDAWRGANREVVEGLRGLAARVRGD